MLQKTQIVSKFYSPLVTIMGLDYNSITKSTAARILSHETPELAADYMYDLIEDGMKSYYDSDTICHHHYTDNGATRKGIG